MYKVYIKFRGINKDTTDIKDPGGYFIPTLDVKLMLSQACFKKI